MKPIVLTAAVLMSIAIVPLAVVPLAVAQTPQSTDGTPTTPSVPPAGMPGTAQAASSARTQIEASGYSNVRDLKRQDDGSWRARATKNDVEVAVSVDSTGNVTQMEQ